MSQRKLYSFDDHPDHKARLDGWVAPDATGYLAHPEHGYVAITPGTYVLRRQREQADELRLVAD